MDRIKTLEMIHIMQAALDGADIQYRRKGGNEWMDIDRDGPRITDRLYWSFNVLEYRIAPQPLTCWVCVYKGTTVATVHPTKEMAVKSMCDLDHDNWQVIEFKESADV